MMNAGDTGFMLICTAFVFFMTPGLAFFYGGLVRRKKCGKYHDGLWGDHGTVRSYVDIVWIFAGIWRKSWRDHRRFSLVCAEWCRLGAGTLCGYDPASGICGVPDDVCHDHTGTDHRCVVGRMRFKALFFFIAIWSLIVYYPMAHMVWGDGGFLATIGSVDFAGGNVVHISSGVSALVLAIYLGQRRGYAKATYRTHNIPFVFLGAAMLWFGWFGFNAGSALKADGLAAHAFMTSSISSACALLTWMLIEVIREGKPTLVGASTGLVIGLVAITPGAGFVPVWASFIIGILVSPICYFTVILLKQKLKIDDAWMLLAAMVSVVSGEESQQVSSEKLPLTRLQNGMALCLEITVCSWRRY